MVKRSLVQVVVCLGLLWPGCGSDIGINGGGGGSAGGSGEGGAGGAGGAEPIAPVVVEVFPQEMATDVEPGTTIRAQFNTELDEATVTSTSFVVRRADGTSVNGSAALDTTGRTVIFSPDSALDLMSPIAAALTTAIRSVNGLSLDANFVWRFTTRAGAWGDPERVETGDMDATSPQVALDASGNAIAVWSQSDQSSPRIWASRFVPGTGWSDAMIISDAGAVGVAQVAADPRGNAVAVWDESDGTSSSIWANRFTRDLGWGGGELIESIVGNAKAAQVGMDTNGNATSLWRQQEATRFDIWANRLVPGTGWNEAATIEVNNAGNANFPRLSVAPSGNAMAIWGQSDGTRINIWANRFVSSSGWENAAIIERAGGDGRLPDVALDSNGNGMAVWTQTDGTRFNVWANRFTRANRWGSAQLIETDDGGSASGARVVVYPQGNALAIWVQSDGAMTNVWANRFSAAGGWGDAELIETDDMGDADSVEIAVTSKGHAVAVWSQSDGTRKNIWANRFAPDVGWGAPDLLEAGDVGDAVDPQISLNGGGRAIVVWTYSDETRSGVWANRFE